MEELVSELLSKKTIAIGSNVLVSGETESLTHSSQYVRVVFDASPSKPVLPPSIFSMANSAFKHMCKDKEDQSILLTGNGHKSEKAALLIQHLVHLSKAPKKPSKAYVGAPLVPLVLAPFTNVNGVSHSGKYYELQFSSRGRLTGMKMVHFPLEDKKHYDIFYCLLAGSTMEERAKWSLYDAHHFKYLRGMSRQTMNDATSFKDLRTNFKALGIGHRQQGEFYQLLSAMLHLGNLEFVDADEEDEPCTIKNVDVLETAGRLLSVHPENLALILTYKTKKIKNELATIILNAKEAEEHRDAFVAAMYEHLLSWIIHHCNSRMCKPDCALFLGIVDFPGFMVESPLSLEALLYNYCSEKLLDFQTVHVLKEPIQDIGVPLPFVRENQAVLSLMGGTDQQPGLLSIINQTQEKAGRRKMDERLLDLLNDAFAQHSEYIPQSMGEFAIHHSCESIAYRTHGMVDKNAHVVCPDFVTIARGDGKEFPASENLFLQDLFDQPQTGESMIDQFLTLLNDVFQTVTDTKTWFILSVNANVTSRSEIKALTMELEQWNIAAIQQLKKKSDYVQSYTFEEFKDQFLDVLLSVNVREASSKIMVMNAVRKFNWMSKDALMTDQLIFLSEESWNSLQDELSILKEQNKSMVSGYVSDDASDMMSVCESEAESTYHYARPIPTTYPTSQLAPSDLSKSVSQWDKPLLEEEEEDEEEQPKKKKMSGARFKWLCCTWLLTWWIPDIFLSCCGRMKQKEVRMAWREKVALCIIILFMCLTLLFFIVGFGRLICPPQPILNIYEVSSRANLNNVWVYAYGRAYQINDIVDSHSNLYNVPKFRFERWVGQDVSVLFNKMDFWDEYCPGIAKPNDWDNVANRPPYNQLDVYYHNGSDSRSGTKKMYLEYMNQYARAYVGWPWVTISKSNKYIVIYNNVYDISTYNEANDGGFFPLEIGTLFLTYQGKDASAIFDKLTFSNATVSKDAVLTCMNNMFYVGTVDTRDNWKCNLNNWILMASSIFIVIIIGFKFLAALRFGLSSDPEDYDKFVVIQIPCYTEGPESLAKTLESIAMCRYDDRRKLMMIICDGMIIGSGNDRPTPRIVLDLLGVDPSIDPEPKAFQSLGEGDKQLNYAKVYSGLYEVQGHSVPYIVVVKVGKPSERQRPGNRGKRDSQLILMRYFNRVHFNSEMNPLELEMYHHMKNIIGVNPSLYEFVMMVDADTEVMPDSMNRMVSAMIHDSKIVGLCGETLLSNEKESFITMIQVYEYFISHHLSKCFESLFGSVTCLPGCFCMYRIRTPTKNIPLLISPAVVQDYSVNRVDTLHLKNLLHLGEDRYLTTLFIKHFPKYKLCFVGDAQCRTNVPDSWSVLKSQRRRWINSTVHNLLELIFLSQLCGVCCFSMRFVVFIDLFSTFVSPAAILYIAYLLYSLITNTTVFPMVSIILLVAIYGLQVIIFILKKQWSQIMWMIVYLLATPIFSFYIPVYAFWHFDDFSWGSTRLVVGDNGKKKKVQAIKPFDPASIPTKRWKEHELDIVEQDMESHHAGLDMDRQSESGFSVSPANYRMSVPDATPRMRTSTIGNKRMSTVSSKVPVGEPTDMDLKREIRRILSNSDLMTITKKQVREQLSSLFSMDLTHRRTTINAIIDEILKSDSSGTS